MDDPTVKYLVTTGQNFLQLNPFQTLSTLLSSGAIRALLLTGSQALRFGILAVSGENYYTNVIAGNHFFDWGPGLAWTRVVLQAMSIIFITLALGVYWKIVEPERMQRMSTPLEKFIRNKNYRSKHYRMMTTWLVRRTPWLVSINIFFMDTVVVLYYPKYSKEFITLLISSVWVYSHVAIAHYFTLILAAIAVHFDITCSHLRHKFKKIERSLLRKFKTSKSKYEMIRLLDAACADVALYDSHWKRILFVIVFGLTIFLAQSIHLFFFSPLPQIVRIFGTLSNVQVVISFSFFLLCPASVDARARRLHSMLSSFVFKTRDASLNFKWKPTYTIKRFNRPIAFTLWDVNAIDYNDYVNFMLGLVSNFLLVNTLLMN